MPWDTTLCDLSPGATRRNGWGWRKATEKKYAIGRWRRRSFSCDILRSVSCICIFHTFSSGRVWMSVRCYQSRIFYTVTHLTSFLMFFSSMGLFILILDTIGIHSDQQKCCAHIFLWLRYLLWNVSRIKISHCYFYINVVLWNIKVQKIKRAALSKIYCLSLIHIIFYEEKSIRMLKQF